MKREILEGLVEISEVIEIESDSVPFTHNLGHELKDGNRINIRNHYQNEAQKSFHEHL